MSYLSNEQRYGDGDAVMFHIKFTKYFVSVEGGIRMCDHLDFVIVN
jgi:hypothetical protein